MKRERTNSRLCIIRRASYYPAPNDSAAVSSHPRNTRRGASPPPEPSECWMWPIQCQPLTYTHTRPPHQATMAAITDATIYPPLSPPPYRRSRPSPSPCLVPSQGSFPRGSVILRCIVQLSRISDGPERTSITNRREKATRINCGWKYDT